MKSLPKVNDVVRYNGAPYICAEIFRATGTTFIRLVSYRDREDLYRERYAASIYLTNTEWMMP